MARDQQLKLQRRRRDTSQLSGRRRHLSVNEAELDREKYTYRWVNDTGDRVYNLTEKDDWERVPDRSGSVKQDGTGMGAEASVHAGTLEGGRSQRAILLRKLREYHDEDVAAAQRAIDDIEASIKEGVVPEASGEKMYTRKGEIEIVGK